MEVGEEKRWRGVEMISRNEVSGKRVDLERIPSSSDVNFNEFRESMEESAALKKLPRLHHQSPLQES